MTFGNKNGAFGGILIRSIQDLNSHEFIEGPCNSVNRMLKLNSDVKELREVQEFVDTPGFSFDIFDKKSRLYLSDKSEEENKKVAPNLIEKRIWRCPRVGLTLKKYD